MLPETEFHVVQKIINKEKVIEFMTREFFTEIMEEVMKSHDYQEGLNKYFEKNDVDGYIYQPDCACATLKLLHHIFGEKDVDEWISYFCFELNFGRNYKDGAVSDEHGNNIPLATIDDLYNLLTA